MITDLHLFAHYKTFRFVFKIIPAKFISLMSIEFSFNMAEGYMIKGHLSPYEKVSVPSSSVLFYDTILNISYSTFSCKLVF